MFGLRFNIGNAKTCLEKLERVDTPQVQHFSRSVSSLLEEITLTAKALCLSINIEIL